MNKIVKGLKFYLQSFYSPSLYRDVVFRGEGYGLKKIYMVFILLMLPSYFIMMGNAIHLYSKSWPKDLEKLPYLTVEHGFLLKINQNINIPINQDLFSWLPSDNVKDDIDNPKKPNYYLGKQFLWAKIPSSYFFGFSFIQYDFYIPIVQWSQIPSPVFGHTILKSLRPSYIWMMFAFFFLSITFMGIFYILFFVRSFAMISRRMVAYVLNEKMAYLPACRLLSLSAIPALTCIVFICDMGWYQDQFKYLFIVMYMFYLYLGVRFIREKSQFRWLDVNNEA
jgi:hypothetical protein